MKRLLTLAMMLAAVTASLGQIQSINTGTTANDGTGDSLRAAFGKVNGNFTYVSGLFAAKENQSANLDLWSAIAPTAKQDALGFTPFNPNSAYGASSGQVLGWNGTLWGPVASGGAGVTSFNTRSGAVTLTSGDVTTALSMTPLNQVGPYGASSGQVLKWNGSAWMPGDDNIGAGGGVSTFNARSGAVTLNSGDVTTALTFSPLNPTTSQTANYVYAAPNGSAGAPGFRLLAGPDIPDLSGSYCQQSDVRLANARSPTAHAATHKNGGGDEVATATPTANSIPKTGASTTLATGWIPDLSGTYQPTFGSKTANYVYAAPNGSAGTPAFRLLAGPDIPDLSSTYCQQSDGRLYDSRSPTAHATSHKNGGGDEIATATAGANAIPKAGAGGTLATGWIPDLSATYEGFQSAGILKPADSQLLTNLIVKNFVSPTNGALNLIVDFSRPEVTTNCTGNFTYAGLANVNNTNYNVAIWHVLANGADRTITVPNSWKTDNGVKTYVATNGTVMDLLIEAQVNYFTNVSAKWSW